MAIKAVEGDGGEAKVLVNVTGERQGRERSLKVTGKWQGR